MRFHVRACQAPYYCDIQVSVLAQQSLDLRTVEERTPRHGGAREGAGRPRHKDRKDPDHVVRPYTPARFPQHVVLRTLPDVPRLRTPAMFAAIRAAMNHMLHHSPLRIVHLSIQGNHLHLIVEAEIRDILIRGMQAFAIVAARAINRAAGRRGKVFAYRYHATPITTPKQMRHTLAYVLNNWRKHGEDRGRDAKIDPYSTAIWFGGWKGVGRFAWPGSWKKFEPLPMANPMTWMLTAGWERYGAIDPYELPGSKATTPKPKPVADTRRWSISP